MSHTHLIDVHVHSNSDHESTRRPTADNARELFDKVDVDDVAVD
jgi:hypothetical protein